MFYYLRLAFSGFKDLITGPFKWFAILFLVWLYRIEFMSDAGVGMGKILQVGCTFGMFYLLWRENSGLLKAPFRETNTPVKSLTWLYLLALTSTLWAFNPQFAFFLSFQNLLMIVLFLWVFSLFDNLREMERAFVFFAIICVVTEFFASRFLHMSLFDHILPSASLSAMMLAYCVGEYLNDKERDPERVSMLKAAGVVFLINLVLNTSGGANASVVVAIGVAMFFGGKKGYALLLILAGVILFFNQELIDDIILTLMPGKNMETIETGNGRDHIWAVLNSYADQKPLLGWGFACIERVDQLGVLAGQSLSDAHSNYVGMRGSLGYVGLAIFVWHLVVTGWYFFKRKAQKGFLGLFAAFTCATVNGYSYGFLSGKTCSITVGYIMVVVLSFYYDNVPLEAEEEVIDE